MTECPLQRVSEIAYRHGLLAAMSFESAAKLHACADVAARLCVGQYSGQDGGSRGQCGQLRTELCCKQARSSSGKLELYLQISVQS